MKRILPLILLLVHGCIFDHEEKHSGHRDLGGYSLFVDPVHIYNHYHGGGLILVYMEPDSGFSGSVDVSVDAEDLRIEPVSATLNAQKKLMEIEVHIDSTLATGERKLVISCLHAKILTTKVNVEVMDVVPTEDTYGPGTRLNIFIIDAVRQVCPEYAIPDDNSWLSFFDHTGDSGIPWKVRYFNKDWDIQYQSFQDLPLHHGISIRKRGELKPCLYIRDWLTPTYGTHHYEVIPEALYGKDWTVPKKDWTIPYP